MINRATALKILNPVLACLVLAQVTTGLCRGFLSRSVFGGVHLWGGILVAVAAVTHLALNWNWVRTVYFKPPARP
jgi:hypothetical protein